MRTSRAFVLAACVLIVASPARPAFAQSGIALRGYAVVGSTSLAAADSFDAVAGTHRTPNIGGGATVTFWRDVFVDVAVQRMKVDGERVFIDEGTVYQLNIPLQVTLIPFDVAAGWRLRQRVLSPYGAVGLTRISYRERSDFADGDDVDTSGTGFLVIGGADAAISRLWHVGAELRYRRADGPLGRGGVSELLNERAIGGFSVSLRVTVGR